MWKRHVDHVRSDSMDRAVSDPSLEMESQDKPPDSPLAIPLSVCVPDPAPAPSVRCCVFVLPPIRAWARLYLVLVLLRQSYAFSVWVLHVLVVVLDICVYQS